MKHFIIEYTAEFEDGIKNGRFFINACSAYEALEGFDKEMFKKENLKWIKQRKFVVIKEEN